MTLDKVLMPVLDGHPCVFDREWPLRVADIDRHGRLRLDAAARHIQDIGQDQLRELGFADTHPLWIVRRTMIDLIEPIRFNDMLRLRRWCSGASTRWCEKRVFRRPHLDTEGSAVAPGRRRPSRSPACCSWRLHDDS
ncbi:MAG: hypothetical protein QOF31_1418 [Mycobacterium sp.]|nr:hypothetical protein [Mycobacterium sp.]